MKTIDKDNKLAKEKRENGRRKLEKSWYETTSAFYLSKNSHRKTNKKK
jgi:hypothetical protein